MAHLSPHQQLTNLVIERPTYEIGKKINFVHATKMKKKLMYQTLKVGKLYSSKLKITQNKICINKQQDQFKVSEI